MYNNASSVRNKQDKLETLVHSQSCDVIGVSETWWNESRDWSAGMVGCGGGIGRAGEMEESHVREKFDCTALTVKDNVAESLWVRSREM